MMRDTLDALLQNGPGAPPHVLQDTGWLVDLSPEALESHYAEYVLKHAAVRVELEALLGPADRTLPGDADWFAAWNLEAFAAAAWEREGRYICLAAEHSDKEAPVALTLSYLTADDVRT
jgi:hypothetical protein